MVSAQEISGTGLVVVSFISLLVVNGSLINNEDPAQGSLLLTTAFCNPFGLFFQYSLYKTKPRE